MFDKMDIKTGKNVVKKEKRQRKRPMHRWTQEQTISLLRAVMEKVKGEPEKFEKPTSTQFYNSIFREYCLEDLEELGVIVVKNKMRNLKDSFIKAEDWIEEIGVYLYEDGNHEKFREHLNKLCSNYKYLSKIFWTKRKDTMSGNDIFFIDMNKTQDNLKSEFFGYETVSEEHHIQESDESDPPEEVDYSMNTLTNSNTTAPITKPKSSERVKRLNHFIQYLAITQEKRNEIEEKKMERQSAVEEKRYKIEVSILEIKRQKLDFYRKMEEKRFDLEKTKIEAELELKRIEIEKQFDLKKYELELKYKCNTN